MKKRERELPPDDDQSTDPDDANERARKQRRNANELFHYQTVFEMEAITNLYQLICSKPLNFIAIQNSNDGYTICKINDPLNCFYVQLPILKNEADILDIKLSPANGDLFYILHSSQNTITQVKANGEQTTIEFTNNIIYASLSPRGQYLLIITADFELHIIDLKSHKRHKKTLKACFDWEAYPKPIFSEDETAVYFTQYHLGENVIFAWNFSDDADESTQLIYRANYDFYQFEFFHQDRLLALCPTHTNDVFLIDLHTGRTAKYLTLGNIQSIRLLPEQQTLCVITYGQTTLNRSSPRQFQACFFDLKSTRLDAVESLPIETLRYEYDYAGTLFAFFEKHGLVRCDLITNKFNKHLITRSISLRQQLHESSFRLLSIGYQITTQRTNTHLTAGQNNRAYRVQTPQDWLKMIGHFAAPNSKTKLDADKTLLYPCTINVGPDNNMHQVRIVNSRQNSAIVKFIMPNGRTIAGDSYPEIGAYLKRLLNIPENEIHATDIIDLFNGTLDRELLRNHRKLAEALILRVAGFAYPNQYTSELQHFLDALLVLLIIVEGSRNNFSLLSFVMLMDCIINHVPINGGNRAYSLINSFFAEVEWDRPFDTGNGNRAFDRGGLFPMVSHASGSGNLSERRTAIEGRFSTFYGSNNKVNLEHFEKRPQKHHILLRETDLFVDWLLWFSDHSLERIISRPDQLNHVISNLLNQRLEEIFSRDRSTVVRRSSNNNPTSDTRPTVGWIDKSLQRVLFLRHTAKPNYGRTITTTLTYFHRLIRPCHSVPEHVINRESKFLSKFKASFTANPCLGAIEHLGIERNIQSPFNNGYRECSLGTIKIFSEDHIELNGAPIQLNAEEQLVLFRYLAAYANFHLQFIDRDELKKHLEKGLSAFFSNKEPPINRKIQFEVVKFLSENIEWQLHPCVKNRARIHRDDISKLIDEFFLENQMKLDDIEAWKKQLITEIIRLLLQVSSLKSQFIHSTDLGYQLFSPKPKGIIFNHKITQHDLDVINKNPLIHRLIMTLTEIYDQFEAEYKISNEQDSHPLLPCPDCFGQVHQANFLSILDYGTPCILDQSTKQFHALDSECEQEITDAQLSYVNNELLASWKPCQSCWLILKNAEQNTLTFKPILQTIIKQRKQQHTAAQQSFFRQQQSLVKRNGKKIANNYWYEDAEMNRLLRFRLNQEQFRTQDNDQIFSYAPLDHLSPYSLIDTLQQHNRQCGHVLIPFNLRGNHWVGLSFQFDEHGKLIRADYYDSLGHGVPTLLNQILAAYTNENDIYRQFNNVQLELIRQNNGSDCGPCTIANLLRSVGIDTNNNLDPIERRLQHLVWLEHDDPNFYQGFYQRLCNLESSFKRSSSSASSQKYELSSKDEAHCLKVSEAIQALPNHYKEAFISALDPKNRNLQKEHWDQITLLRTIFSELWHSDYDNKTQLFKYFFYSDDQQPDNNTIGNAYFIFDFNHLDFLYACLTNQLSFILNHN